MSASARCFPRARLSRGGSVLPKSALPSPAERGGGACHLYDVSHIWTPLFLKILVQATIWVSILFVA
jgi:hypothetical protein